MPVSLTHIRDELMPGLMEISQRYQALPTAWESVFAKQTVEFEVAAAKTFNAGFNPVISPAAAAAMGAAAVIIKNPEVTRRFWEFWK